PTWRTSSPAPPATCSPEQPSAKSPAPRRAGLFFARVSLLRDLPPSAARPLVAPPDAQTTQSTDFNPSPRFDDQPDLGDIKINHNVVASIVRLASLQVEGVAGVGGGIVDGISEIFAKRESDHRGVRVSEDDQDSYTIEVRLIVS